VLSAFSGLGGLDLGIEAAGFRHVGCIERDEFVRRSLKANRGDAWHLLEPGDLSVLIDSLTPETLDLAPRDLSLLAGGPPCQPFSKAAQWSASARIGLEDIRSHCLRDYLTLIERFLPKVVLIENVSGFIQGGVSALAEIESRLVEINVAHGTKYRSQHRIVDAADYGVPQHRQRAIIVMTREGETFKWPHTTHAGKPLRAWDAIGNLDLGENVPRSTGKWAELLPSIPEGENYLWHTQYGGGLPIFGYRTRFWSFLLKLAKNQPSWTLPAQPGPSTGPFHWDNRPLAIPEMLRLQSFDADWVVEGDHREQVRQVGNATPPRLAEVIARAIASQFCDLSFENQRLRYFISRSKKIPSRRATAGVDAKYASLIGHHPDHPGTGKGPKPRAVPIDPSDKVKASS
jgi:DNA (cytosine-5)-methyltransferase 1